MQNHYIGNRITISLCSKLHFAVTRSGWGLMLTVLCCDNPWIMWSNMNKKIILHNYSSNLFVGSILIDYSESMIYSIQCFQRMILISIMSCQGEKRKAFQQIISLSSAANYTIISQLILSIINYYEL